MRGVWNAVALVVLVALLGFFGWYYGVQDPIKNHMKLGLDLKGGVHMVLQGVNSELGEVTKEKMEAAMTVVEQRVNSLGVSEPLIQLDAGNNRIIVQIAGETDTERARAMVGKTAVLTFVDPDGKVVLDGRDIERAGVAPDQSGGGYEVTLQLKGDGPKKFADATTRLVGQPIYIKLDDATISDPRVSVPITDGSARITGSYTVTEARDLAQLINGGALPVKLEMSETRVVSATLGTDSLNKSAIAGLIGMGFVVFFIIALYWLPGLMATIALTIYSMLTLGFLLSINAVFTLPGIAGLLLSIGMAVDANVIIFERIKEELRNGKGLRSGIDAGFHRAFSAVIDSNITTLIAGGILYWLGTTAVKGFALTLSVGVCLSLFTSITVTRWLLNTLVGIRPWKKSLFGVKEVSQ
ncbi:MAG TPA: protein translocase subunit SecD [Symbiobacteriaceae bacterium]|nr:protein translocase subunit SecD [Symbiobacteriaceae bacterium]